jgi:hypothetical protein
VSDTKFPQKSKLTFHPLNTLPLIEGQEFDELVGDIQRRGYRPEVGGPIWMFEGKVLAGRNRVRACAKAKFELQPEHFKQFEGTEEDARRFLIEADILRRQLKPTERLTGLKSLLKMCPEMSDRAIGKATGYDHKTVAKKRKEAEANGEIPHKDRVERSGRQARGPKPGSGRPKSKSAPTEVPKLVGDWTHPIETADAGKYRTVVKAEPSDTDAQANADPMANLLQAVSDVVERDARLGLTTAPSPDEIDTLRTFATFIMANLRDGTLTITGDPKRMERFRELKERINPLIPATARALA